MGSLATKAYLFIQDRTSHQHEGDLTESIKDGDQNSHEDDTTTGEAPSGGQRKIEVGGTDNERQDDREAEAGVELEPVLHLGLELADRKGLDLSPETESVWALLGNPLLLVVKNGGTERFLITLLLGLLTLVLLQRANHVAVKSGGAERVLESLRVRGNIGGRTSKGELTFVGISATGQVVGGTLTGKRLVTEGLEVRTSFRSRSKIDLAALIDHEDLVEEVVDTLTGLVEGDESGLAEDVCHDSQGLDEIECGTGIQSTGGIIPGLNPSAGSHHLSDRNPLTFTATDTTNEGIADERLFGVRDVEHAEEEIFDFIDKPLASDTGKATLRAGRLSGKCEI